MIFDVIVKRPAHRRGEPVAVPALAGAGPGSPTFGAPDRECSASVDAGAVGQLWMFGRSGTDAALAARAALTSNTGPCMAPAPGRQESGVTAIDRKVTPRAGAFYSESDALAIPRPETGYSLDASRQLLTALAGILLVTIACGTPAPLRGQ